jgi:hypothetical protein
MIREILFRCVCHGSDGGHYLFQDQLKTKSYRQKNILKSGISKTASPEVSSPELRILLLPDPGTCLSDPCP